MLELLDKSKTVKRFLWLTYALIVLLVVYWRLPDVLTALAAFKE